MNLDGLEGATTAPPLSSSATLVLPKKKITIQEYHCRKAAEEQWVTTFLDQDKNGEDLDYEDFDPQDDLANIQISYRTPMPVMQIPDLPLQDASTLVPQKATTPVTPDVTIPMLQDNTSPGTIPGTATYNVTTATNQGPGFGRGLRVARASPMQLGTPAASPQRTPGHSTTAEEVLLQGATLPCSPWQEANLLNPMLMLTDNHIKMMDSLYHLDTTGLQFICKSVEALHRERTPTQAPPDYCTLQASDILRGTASHSPLSQEFYRATSNLGTAIVEPQQIPPQQCLAGDHHPDPKIENAIANMQRQNRHCRCCLLAGTNKEGVAFVAPSIIHCPDYTWSNYCSSIPVPSARQKTKIQGSRPLLIHCVFIPYAFVSFILLFGFLYLCTACVLFRIQCKYFCIVQ